MSEIVGLIRKAATNPSTGWVLYQNGTVVFLPCPNAGDDLGKLASALLREWGPVHAGGPAGDFGVISLAHDSGWAVSCHHRDILTFLTRDQVRADCPEVEIGLLGRALRHQDGINPTIVHVELPASPGAWAEPTISPREALARLDLGPLEAISEATVALALPVLESASLDEMGSASLLSAPSTQTVGALALLLRPTAAGLAALWEAIDNDDLFHPGLLAIACCLDPEASDKARKRLLLRKPEHATSGDEQRCSCLCEVVWQNESQRDWLRSRVDFLELACIERLSGGRAARREMLAVWGDLRRVLPHLWLPEPPCQPAALLEHCWPGPWPLPLPEKATRAFLLEQNSKPLARWLLAGGSRMTLEVTPKGDLRVERELKTGLRLPGGLGRLAFHAALTAGLGRRWFHEESRGLFVAQGFLFALTPAPLQSTFWCLQATGIDHDGKMKGSTAQAMLKAAGPEIESAARAALATTNRRLGTVVITPGFGIPACRYVAHVVSTPKHTSESPGWLRRAVFGVLDQAVEREVRRVAFAALGTNGGISPEVAARVMLEAAQAWHSENLKAPPLEVTFALPAKRVYEAFRKEFRRQKLDVFELEALS